jgi:hypothetical protein
MHTPCTSRPPRNVAIAAWLLMGYGVLSLLRLWWFGAGLPGSVAGVLIWVVALLVFAGIARSLYAGHNLTRWVMAVVVAVSAVLMPIYKPELPTGVHLPVYLLQFVLPVLATLLIFTPSARAWFVDPASKNG